MMRIGLVCVAFLLGGCLSQPSAPEPARYDLGIAPAGEATRVRMNSNPAVVRVRATARSWLDHTAMHPNGEGEQDVPDVTRILDRRPHLRPRPFLFSVIHHLRAFSDSTSSSFQRFHHFHAFSDSSCFQSFQ